jgi:NAD(P)-dependent dehydrogenase (short-subunit alcohol dehydrogenase family)
VARLEGKTVVVTGGASGMGEASAELFVREGANVVIGDVQRERAESLAAKLGADRVVAVETDVSVSADVGALVQTAVERFGRLDVMFNNAGIGGGELLIHETPEEVFDRIIAVDLKGVWLGIKHAVPALMNAGGGSIINTASVSALMGMRNQGGYGAAKGGVVQLTRVAAIEYANVGIRVNAILPGGILTPLIWNNPGLAEPLDPELVGKMLAQAQPIPRAGLPTDIAHAALWLASDESSFVTGQSIVVDGGWTASAKEPRELSDQVADSVRDGSNRG